MYHQTIQGIVSMFWTLFLPAKESALANLWLFSLKISVEYFEEKQLKCKMNCSYRYPGSQIAFIILKIMCYIFRTFETLGYWTLKCGWCDKWSEFSILLIIINLHLNSHRLLMGTTLNSSVIESPPPPPSTTRYLVAIWKAKSFSVEIAAR